MIGTVIRHYRKEQGLTQEEMAKRLGVTTPAVNKWENNNSLPDVSLLGPIARLLGISTDTLLDYKEELSSGEIDILMKQLHQDLEQKDFAQVFREAETQICLYPNSSTLIWQTAVVLQAYIREKDIDSDGGYQKQISAWYERCLKEEEPIRRQAASSLFYASLEAENYEEARSCLSYFSDQSPLYKEMKALLFSRSGRKEEAYQAFEELLFTGCQSLQTTLNHLRILYQEDGDIKMVGKLVQIHTLLAQAFDMGHYQAISPQLDLAVFTKDISLTESTMRDLLNSVESLHDFVDSPLYQHMDFKPCDPEFIQEIRVSIKKSFADPIYTYMQGNEYWEKTLGEAEENK